MICKNSAPTDRLLAAQNLSFSLGHQPLLQDINLELAEGKLTVLIGPNGVGKSTLMRLLSGYLAPQAGQVLWKESPLASLSNKELALKRAVMQQQSRLNFPYSVEEVILMGAYHRPAKEVETHLEAVIEAAQCQPLRHKTYRQLSGGEQQRVQLARALLQLWNEDMQSKLLFLDEPTSAFDLYHQQHCLRLISQLCQQKGLTACCVLHDLNLASLYADQVILLAEGKIQAQGQPQEVFTQACICRWYQADIEVIAHQQTQCPQVQFLK
ncbi:heme ABC transporter ATP-binding protein [Pasteurellaceae bacterium RH1A]|nr:heme ABC transporter ATP-binding protein [Pasteurellaceae bacterium RH1A]